MTQQQSAESVLTGVRNFRDLGGLPVAGGGRLRHGQLYRSGHLAHATADDQRFLGGLGLHTVYDFRSAGDQALEGLDVELPGVRNLNIPLNNASDSSDFWRVVRGGTLGELRSMLGAGRAVRSMEESYRAMVRHRTAEHGQILRGLARESTPALLHCSAGKDRAGLTVALVLLAVGTERDAIISDYLLSNDPSRRYRITREDGAEGGLSAEVMELLGPLFDARAEYLAAALDEITERWGGEERYLAEGLGVTDTDRVLLRERLLEG